MSEIQTGRRVRRQRRKVALRPKGGSRIALAVVTALGSLIAAFVLLPAGGTRTILTLFVAPLLPLAVTFVPAVWPRLAAERAIRRRGKRPYKQPLAVAAKSGKLVVLTGQLKPKVQILSPGSRACAAWVARALDAHNVVQTSEVADATLATEQFGEVALARGRWRLANPFDPFDENGEATILAGEQVLVSARVESVVLRGEGYRDNAVGYRLRAAGGLIAPRNGRYLHKAVNIRGWVISTVLVSITAAAVAFGGASWSGKPFSYEHSGADIELAPITPLACDENRTCSDGFVCDVESMECVRSIEGKLREGDACKQPGDCAAGLRCRWDLAASPGERRCTRPCKADGECSADKWCVPCQLEKAATDGDCIDPSRLEGAVSEVCKMVHPKAKPTDEAELDLPPEP